MYSCPFDSTATETKGTVLLKTASELKTFSKGEEDLIERVSVTPNKEVWKVCILLWGKWAFMTFFVFDIVPAKLLDVSVEALQSTAVM